MSLYFKERVEEDQKISAADPSKNNIIFTYPWIITIPTGAEDDQNQRTNFHGKFGTNFAFGNEIWHLDLSLQGINLRTANTSMGHESTKVWNGSCFIFYDLFYHNNDMNILLYSSPQIKMTEIPAEDEFKTSETFVAKMFEAIQSEQITKMVVFVELHLEATYFYRPFEKLCKKMYDEYPKEMELDYRFGFLKKSDFTFKCPDGDVPSRRIIINITSKLMKKRFLESNWIFKDREFSIDHKIDVVKPIVIFLHTTCFQMPESYNLEYASRLLIAVEFFDADKKFEIRKTIEQSLCKKFADENDTFETILQWTSFACRQSLFSLKAMIASVIANKYFYRWHQTFPENTRNLQNDQYLEIFGGSEHTWMLEKVDQIYKESFKTTVILP